MENKNLFLKFTKASIAMVCVGSVIAISIRVISEWERHSTMKKLEKQLDDLNKIIEKTKEKTDTKILN